MTALLSDVTVRDPLAPLLPDDSADDYARAQVAHAHTFAYLQQVRVIIGPCVYDGFVLAVAEDRVEVWYSDPTYELSVQRWLPAIAVAERGD